MLGAACVQQWKIMYQATGNDDEGAERGSKIPDPLLKSNSKKAKSQKSICPFKN